MEPERIELSAKERERLKVLHEVEEGHLKQVEAAHRLRLTDRHVRRLQARLRGEGDAGLVHRLRGRRSNRKIPEAFTARALRVLRRARYAGFGPTLAAEHLARQGIAVSRETLRQWMRAAGLWHTRRRCVPPVHVWRPRRAAFGELVMMDSSPYRWLEDRGPASHLIALIDDATSRVWGRLVEHDSTEENLRTLQGWLQRYGRPLALYTDKSGLFVTSRPVQWQEQLRGEPARTQFGRALAELDIEWIAAHSPQAKGRIERLFGTLQDRPLGERDAGGRHRHAGRRQWLSADHLLAVVGEAFYGTARADRRRAPAAGTCPAAGADPQRARGAHCGGRLYGKLEGPTLGCAAGRCLRGAARRWRGNRTPAGWQSLASFSRPLLAASGLSGRAAIRKSFRPTACRTCGSKSKTQNRKKGQIYSASGSPLADISIWQKTGHFYFALTGLSSRRRQSERPPGKPAPFLPPRIHRQTSLPVPEPKRTCARQVGVLESGIPRGIFIPRRRS
jgi:Helix-turn-helix domain